MFRSVFTKKAMLYTSITGIAGSSMIYSNLVNKSYAQPIYESGENENIVYQNSLKEEEQLKKIDSIQNSLKEKERNDIARTQLIYDKIHYDNIGLVALITLDTLILLVLSK